MQSAPAAIAEAAPASAAPALAITIPFRLLLSVYLILPLLILAAALDASFFHGAIRAALPDTPEAFVWYAVIFGLPHIMASFFSFADKEYLAYYQDRLLLQLPLLLLTVGIGTVLFPPAAYFAFAVYTMYHVISQQAGIVLIFSRGPTPLYGAWKWTSIIGSSFVYLLIYYRSLIPSPLSGAVSGRLIAAIILALIALSLFILMRIKTRDGRLYFAATAAAYIISPLFFVWGYAVFAVLGLRVVHDVTAFIFYTTHEANRNRERRANVLYRYLPARIPIMVFVPLIAIAIALPISLFAGTVVAFLLAFTHYYIEGFVWKRDGIHRTQLSFSA